MSHAPQNGSTPKFCFAPDHLKNLLNYIYPLPSSSSHLCAPQSIAISSTSSCATIQDLPASAFHSLYVLSSKIQFPSDQLLFYFADYFHLEKADAKDRYKHPVRPLDEDKRKKWHHSQKNLALLRILSEDLKFYTSIVHEGSSLPSKLFQILRDLVWIEIMRRRRCELVLKGEEMDIYLPTLHESIKQVEQLLEEHKCDEYLSALPATYYTVHNNRFAASQWIDRLHECDPQTPLWYHLRILRETKFESALKVAEEAAKFIAQRVEEEPSTRHVYCTLKGLVGVYFRKYELSERAEHGIDSIQPKTRTSNAIRMLREASDEGDLHTMYELGQCLYAGLLVEMNRPLACQKWEIASQVSADALVKLSSAYEKGCGVKQNTDTANFLMSAAISTGHPKALRKKAINLFHGLGYLAPDEGMAFKYFVKSSIHGDALAQFYMAVQYYEGTACVDKDVVTAFDWLSESARNGCARSQFHLGLQMMDESPHIAYEWISRAAAHGDEEAQSLLVLRENETIIGNM